MPDGPFANVTVNIGPGFKSEPRCVNRSITSFFSAGCGAAFVAAAIEPDTYDDMWVRVYSGPHLAGHVALAMMVGSFRTFCFRPGRDLTLNQPCVKNGDSITSPGDPLFMLHHDFVDKMWWDRQARDPAVRLTAMGGPSAQDPAVGFFRVPRRHRARVQDVGEAYARDAGRDARCSQRRPRKRHHPVAHHDLGSLGIIPDATVADVMDIQGGYLCYEYV